MSVSEKATRERSWDRSFVSLQLSESPNSSSNQEQGNKDVSKDTEGPAKAVERDSSGGHRRKELLFTADNDKCLRTGIIRNGFGQWSAILGGSQTQVSRG